MNPRPKICEILCEMKLDLIRIETKLDTSAHEASTKLDAILRRESRLERQEVKIMGTLEDVKAAVAAEATVVDSAVALLGGLKASLDAAIASNDPAALQALSDSIGAQTAELSTAVATNTPAA